MNTADISEISALLHDEEAGASYIFEIHHALIEYIRSGNAISDMGHPDFFLGASGDTNRTLYSRYPPSLAVFQLARACSKYLKNFDTRLIWYRDLSTWEKFCQFIVELHQLDYLRSNYRKAIKSHKYYLRQLECPACGSRQYNSRSGSKDEIHLDDKDNLVYIECRRCGRYIMTHSAFKSLDSFEKKAKLYVFLSTRANRQSEFNTKITPKVLREILN
jgi:transcription elongation factor Elf1